MLHKYLLIYILLHKINKLQIDFEDTFQLRKMILSCHLVMALTLQGLGVQFLNKKNSKSFFETKILPIWIFWNRDPPRSMELKSTRKDFCRNKGT